MAHLLFSRLILLFVCFTDRFVLCVLTTSLFLTLSFPVPWELDYTFPVSTRDASLQSRYGCPCSTNMTSEAGRNQILAKWQEAFTRLNGKQTRYCRVDELHKGARCVSPLSRYDLYRCLRLRRLDAEIHICDV